jgi:stage V sporulation protein AC
MDNKEYDKLVKSIIGKEKIYKNILIAFVSGGLIGVISQVITNILISFGFSNSNSLFLTFCIFILTGSILTGIGVFDKVLSFCKCGLIVPSTGFANSMTSAAMDARSEGFVKGIGSSMFKLTGSIILYGIVFGILFGYIRSII